MFDIKYVANPKDLFYTPDYKNLPIRRYHTSRFYPIQYKSAKIEMPQMKIDIQSIVASNWFDEEPHDTDLPFFPQEILKLMHNFGYSMLLDDKKDIGKFSTVAHPSAVHHWYIGAAMMALAQLGGMVQKMKEFAEIGAGMGSEFQNLQAIGESPLLARKVEKPQRIPISGMLPSSSEAIPYTDLVLPHHYAARSLPLNQGQTRQLPNSMLKPLPQLPAPRKSIAPNPLRGIVNH